MGNPEAEPLIHQNKRQENTSESTEAPPDYSEISTLPTAPTFPTVEAPSDFTENPVFGNEPILCTCPHCQYEVNNKIFSPSLQ